MSFAKQILRCTMGSDRLNEGQHFLHTILGCVAATIWKNHQIWQLNTSWKAKNLRKWPTAPNFCTPYRARKIKKTFVFWSKFLKPNQITSSYFVFLSNSASLTSAAHSSATKGLSSCGKVSNGALNMHEESQTLILGEWCLLKNVR